MTISKPKSMLPPRDSMSYIDHLVKQWSKVQKNTAYGLDATKRRLVAPKITTWGVPAEWED